MKYSESKRDKVSRIPQRRQEHRGDRHSVGGSSVTRQERRGDRHSVDGSSAGRSAKEQT